MIKEIETTYKAGAYIRLSLADDDKDADTESVSIKNQRSLITEYAKNNNIELVDYYVDDGYSGGNFERPGFKRLINDIECGYINCVITKDTSRLGREFIETGNYMFKYFPEHNVRYIAILENYDTANPNGVEDIIPFKTVINDMYLKDVSRKIKSVRHDMMTKGLFVGSSVPYGYKRSEEDSRKFVIDEYAAQIVRRIFNLAEKGNSPLMIARALTEYGIQPPNIYKGKKVKNTFTINIWKGDSVKTILTNEAYIGTLVQGKYERVSLKSKKKRLLPKSKWIIKKNCHEPIITKEQFEYVNEKCLKKKSQDDTRMVTYDYLLKGLVVCADCGKTMLVRRVKSTSKKNKGEIRTIYCCRTYAKYRNNTCSMHYFREDELNKIVLDEIRRVLTSYSKEKVLSNNYNSTLSKSDLLKNFQEELKDNKLRITDIERAISDLYTDKAKGLIDNDEFIEIKKSLEKDRKEILNKISELEIMAGNTKVDVLSEKSRQKMINDFLKMKNPNKQIIKDTINKITIDKNKKVKIYFNFNLNGEV